MDHRVDAKARFGGLVNASTNAPVAATSTNVGHGLIDVLIGGLGLALQECSGGQNLSRLAVAALGHIKVFPCHLHGVARIGRESLNGGDVFALSGRVGIRARPHRCAIHQDRASTALGHAAPILGAREPQLIPDHPQKGHVRFNVQGVFFAIDEEVGHENESYGWG